MVRFERTSNVNEAKVIQVIAVESLVGNGKEDNPIRPVREYFTLEGDLLARTESIEDLHSLRPLNKETSDNE